jgi:hypothetical protein
LTKSIRNSGAAICPRTERFRNVMHMARRAAGGGKTSRAWRTSALTVAAVATFASGLAGTAHADDSAPPSTVPTGELDGAVVAVDLPPVPPTTVVVAVDEPPVPPTSVVVAVDEPPVPPTSVVVAVDEPPVPPVTVPDAAPVVASSAGAAPADEPPNRATSETDDEPLLPETGAAAARATAIVAGAAVSIGAALRALAQRP